MPKYAKRDRTARLLGVAHLLRQYPHGLSAQEIAERMGTTVRTAYRDVHALEEEVGIPIWEDRARFGVLEGAFLPPLNLTLLQAVALLLSARLMARFEDRRDDNVVRAFGALATVLPSPIAEHVYATLSLLNTRPRDEHFSETLKVLVQGWAEGRKVIICYPHTDPGGNQSPLERTLSPYFVEPHPGGHSLYVLAHDSLSNAERTFKVERIQSARLTEERFTVPEDFDLERRLRDSWIVTDEEPVDVRLLFHDPKAAARVRENRWHTSQQESTRADGKLELRFTVAGLLEIQSWILGWGGSVEVLAPRELREEIAATARGMAARYDSLAVTVQA